MPLIETKGAASAQGFGEFAKTSTSVVANYIEDVFSTYLYDGGTAQSINNGIDLSTKGGLVWFKFRSGSATETNNELYDTARGTNNFLVTNTTAAQVNDPSSLNSFNTNGFSMSIDPGMNASGSFYASWTFRKQPKFFDIVTYTGTGSNRTIAHNLGSAPGFIIIKSTTLNDDWYCYHQSLTASGGILLNSTNGYNAAGNLWNSTYPTSTVFSLGTNTGVNQSGQSYVAYLFAHNAGGFGLTGTDNVISCGSFVGNNGTNPVNLGYEAQLVLIKNTTNTTGSSNWVMYDNMRGLSMTSASVLRPNLAFQETSDTTIAPSATGFTMTGGGGSTNYSGDTYIYIAIRRGPMKVPTTGTSVFAPFYASYSEGAAITTNFPIDLSMWKGDVTYNWSWQDRLRGTPTSTGSGGPALASNSTAAETTSYTGVGITKLDSNTGGSVSYQADSGRSNAAAYFMLRRAPSFFDEVCYTGTSTNPQNYSHNLQAVPEMMIVRRRNQAGNYWFVYHKNLTAGHILQLQSTASSASDTSIFTTTAPTASVFTVGGDSGVNSSAGTYVAYLFATCAGVSKVGSYTGNGSTQQIDCGFTGGARFVMIKQTSGSGGDWYVYSSALGIVAGSDRTVLFNSNNSSSAFGDTLDALSSGFELGPDSSSFGSNTSGATYIFLAIA